MPRVRRSPRLPLAPTALLARAAGRASRVLGRGRGTSLPGLVAQGLDPTVLERLASGLPDGVVLVTGTNGKTTTCDMIRAALTTAGARVVANTAGSNLRQGVLTALLDDCDARGRPRSTVAVLEVDEATLPEVARAVRPRLVVVLNLFRDQLDRYAELDHVAEVLGDALSSVTGDVLLDADDARVAALAQRCGGAVTFFGLDPTTTSVATVEGAADASPCPSCGARLTYDWVTYAHLGGYRCRACGFARPRPAVVVTDAEPTDDGWRASVRSRSGRVAVRTAQRGLHSLYNLAAAAAAAELVGAPLPAAAAAAAASEPVPGRGAVTRVGRGEVVVLLGKNPTGLSQVLRSHVAERPEAPLLLVLNDEAADGRDVSWIWDAPLELLRGRAGEVLVAGSRAESMLVRLRYAEVRAAGRPSPAAALDELVARVRLGGRAYVVTTYSEVSALAVRLDRLAAAAPVGAAR